MGLVSVPLRPSEAFGALALGSAGHVRPPCTPRWCPRRRPCVPALFQRRLHLSVLGRPLCVGAEAARFTICCSHSGIGVARNSHPVFQRVRGRRQIAGWWRALSLANEAARAVVRVEPRRAVAIHGPRAGLVPCVTALLDTGVDGPARPRAHRARQDDALAYARPHVAVPVDVLVVVVDPAVQPAALLGGCCPQRCLVRADGATSGRCAGRSGPSRRWPPLRYSASST